MKVREGLIPTALGTVVTGAGAALSRKKALSKIGIGILGFGLAHVVLGAIDLVQHNEIKL